MPPIPNASFANPRGRWSYPGKSGLTPARGRGAGRVSPDALPDPSGLVRPASRTCGLKKARTRKLADIFVYQLLMRCDYHRSNENNHANHGRR